jgi:hypothetical protein
VGALFFKNGAEPMPPIPGACMTSDVAGLLRTIRATGDRSIMPLVGDALLDAGCDNEELLDEIRVGRWGLYCLGFQETREGERVVTASWHRPYCLKVFVALKRKKDGLLTWRLQSERRVGLSCVPEAREFAQEHQMKFLDSCRHGDVCR